MTGPLWLCTCPTPGHSCWHQASSKQSAVALATATCPQFRTPSTVVLAGYIQDPDDTPNRRPRSYPTKTHGINLSELPPSARWIMEVYREARDGGSLRHAAALRNLMADVGAALERSNDSSDLVLALAGEDYAAVRATWAVLLKLVDCGWSSEDAARFAYSARKVGSNLKLEW